jgi:hypothetical protein
LFNSLFAVLFGFGFAEGVGAAVALFVVVGGVEDDVLRFQGKVFAGAHLGAFGGQGAAGRETDVVPGQGGDFSGAAGFLAAGGDRRARRNARIGFCLFLVVDRNRPVQTCAAEPPGLTAMWR